jgi:hypothetical protein
VKPAPIAPSDEPASGAAFIADDVSEFFVKDCVDRGEPSVASAAAVGLLLMKCTSAERVKSAPITHDMVEQPEANTGVGRNEQNTGRRAT